jgi:hypothetical protein
LSNLTNLTSLSLREIHLSLNNVPCNQSLFVSFSL